MVVTAEERRQINRNNSRKSCGPKSPEGKKRSSRNGFKHGLRAQAAALPAEDAREIAELTAEWLDYYQPETLERRALIDRAVLATIQLRRCARFQTAATALQIRIAGLRFDAEQEEKVARFKALFDADPATAVRGLRRSAAGCRWLLSQWEPLELLLSAEGCWRSAADRDLATRLFGVLPDAAGSSLQVIPLAAHPGNEPSLAELRARVAEQLRELRECERHLRIAIEEPGRAAAEDRALSLDGEEDRLLLRYERMHERAFSRAYNKLLIVEAGVAARNRPSPAAPALEPFVLQEDDVPREERPFPDAPPVPVVVVVPPTVQDAVGLAAPSETRVRG